MPQFIAPIKREITSERIRDSSEIITWTDEQSLDLCDRLMAALGLLNINIPENTRYHKYISNYRSERSSIASRALAIQEIYQLLVAVEGQILDEKSKALISTALTYDSAEPIASVKNSPGRDASFELYVAGRLRGAGMVAECAEPDLICRRGSFEFSIAAKRIKSRDKLIARVIEARRQIVKSNIPGIIALDLSPLWSRYYTGVVELDLNELQIEAIKLLETEFEKVFPEIRRKGAREPVIGVIAFLVCTAFNKNGVTTQVAPVHNGKNLCPVGSERHWQMWHIVDQLSRVHISL